MCEKEKKNSFHFNVRAVVAEIIGSIAFVSITCQK